MLSFIHQKSLPLVKPQMYPSMGTLVIKDHIGRDWWSGLNPYNKMLDVSASQITSFKNVSSSLYKVAANGYNIYYLDSNGMIWSVGDNYVGTLGNNTNIDSTIPVQIARAGSYKNVVCAKIRTNVGTIDTSNGMVYTWGNSFLGNNTLNAASSPVSIARNGSYTKLLLNERYGNAVLDGSNGMIYTWGNGALGVLGTNSTTNRSSPVAIARTSSYVDICNGRFTFYAIDGADGSVWSWGRNWYGNIGDGTEADRSSPKSFLAAGSFREIAAVGETFFALRSDGVLWACGINALYTFGNESQTYATSPISIANNVKHIYTYNVDTLALDQAIYVYNNALYYVNTNGDIIAYGYNNYGMFGNDTYASTFTPKSQAKSWKKYIGGLYFNYLIDSNDMVYGWGNILDVNIYGTIGTNDIKNYLSPTAIARSGSYKDVYIDGASLVAMFHDATTGYIWSCGSNFYGQFGDNSRNSASSPVVAVGNRSFSKGINGTNFVAAIDGSDGMVYVWGVGTGGVIGNNTITSYSSPTAIARISSYVDIAAYNNVSIYAIDGTNGTIWSWGRNTGTAIINGCLGDNTITNRSSPVMIARSASYKKVVSSYQVAFAIDASNGTIWGWGPQSTDPGIGIVGDNSIIDRSSPVMIARSSSYVDIAQGRRSVLAIDGIDGSVWAWGDNSVGQLGVGIQNAGNVSSPMSVKIGKSCISVYTTGKTSYIIDCDGICWIFGDQSNLQMTDIEFNRSPVTIGKVILRG